MIHVLTPLTSRYKKQHQEQKIYIFLSVIELIDYKGIPINNVAINNTTFSLVLEKIDSIYYELSLQQ